VDLVVGHLTLRAAVRDALAASANLRGLFGVARTLLRPSRLLLSSRLDGRSVEVVVELHCDPGWWYGWRSVHVLGKWNGRNKCGKLGEKFSLGGAIHIETEGTVSVKERVKHGPPIHIPTISRALSVNK